MHGHLGAVEHVRVCVNVQHPPEINATFKNKK